ncbi:hypothetical protein ACHAXS_006921 [Conticribra weissflogii]
MIFGRISHRHDPRNECLSLSGSIVYLSQEAVQILSSKGIETRCLLRHPIDADVTPSIDKDATSPQVAKYLSQLPGVTMVDGDATNPSSCADLVQGCDAILAMHGPVKTKPLQSLLRLLPESDPIHSRSVNYVAVQNLIDAAKSSPSCKRIVRVTGKGEEPTAFFTVLINMFGNMAKAWNYEGEQLLRTCRDVDYTIIRPGVMGRDDVPGGKVLALADNGGDLPVTAVTHEQIAGLCVECLDYPNAARATLTAMNVEDGKGEESYAPLLAKVGSDTREFPASLLEEHKRGARMGSAVLVAFFSVFAAVTTAVGKVVGSFVLGFFSK